MVQDLELLEDLKINDSAEEITVNIQGSIFHDLCNQLRTYTYICSNVGCPLTSAIACAIAKVTNKAVIIDREEPSSDGKTIEITYHLINR